MTTRAGFTGLLTGLISTIIICPFFIARPEAYLHGGAAGLSALCVWIPTVLTAMLLTGGGFFAARWSGSAQPARCAALGALAGGLAGTIIFCLWGAAAAGTAVWISPLSHAANEVIPQIEIISTVVRQTMGMFLALFTGGGVLGALGGRLACRRGRKQADVFNMTAPQMAMNASITAVPASVIAAALAAGVFSRLTGLIGRQTGQAVFDESFADLPLLVSLLLVLVSHFALTLVIPHETRQAEHRCGLDEVKMAAYVGMGAAPVLILLLLLAKTDAFSNPLVAAALLASTGMSLKSTYTLFKQVLPRRASFSTPREDWQMAEAKWFGSISKSRGPRLVMLCIGCGLVMVMPLYVCVLSVLINLTGTAAGPVITEPVYGVAWSLFVKQAAASIGLVVVMAAVLSIMYLFYLNLGRWFSKRNSPPSQDSL